MACMKLRSPGASVKKALGTSTSELHMPISSARWQAYPWKNELVLQAERGVAHGREVIDEDFRGSHNPLDMLDRAIVLAGFCIRRLIEKKLVTDAFAASKRAVLSFPARTGETFKPPFRSESGGNAYSNYDFDAPQIIEMAVGDLANELIHSSQLMVLDGEEFAANGFLIASDWHLTKRVLHMSFDEFTAFAASVLDDRVYFKSDQWDPETGMIRHQRLGPERFRRSSQRRPKTRP